VTPIIPDPLSDEFGYEGGSGLHGGRK
jgi:hypothetical protein